MTFVLELQQQQIARFQAIVRPLLLGRGEWGTARYRFGGLEVWARVSPTTRSGGLYLYWVGAHRPGHGEGAVGMRSLTAVADEARVALELHADPCGTKVMERDVLRAWYERFGFVARSEHLVPYWPGRLGLAMCRKPG